MSGSQGLYIYDVDDADVKAEYETMLNAYKEGAHAGNIHELKQLVHVMIDVAFWNAYVSRVGSIEDIHREDIREAINDALRVVNRFQEELKMEELEFLSYDDILKIDDVDLLIARQIMVLIHNTNMKVSRLEKNYYSFARV